MKFPDLTGHWVRVNKNSPEGQAVIEGRYLSSDDDEVYTVIEHRTDIGYTGSGGIIFALRSRKDNKLYKCRLNAERFEIVGKPIEVKEKEREVEVIEI